ncbi:MAG: HAMP domain-containing sensor histidine kinase [Pirellulaceae bacterium]
MNRRSLSIPITLAVVMIVLLIVLTFLWVMITVRQAIDNDSIFYWILLSVGAALFLVILVGVIMYLTLSIKAINISRRQSNFIDSVTHELKSPIASLKLYLQTLTRRRVSAAEQDEFYQCMLEDVNRLDKLINHILDAARLDRDKREDTIEEFALDQLVQQTVETARLAYRVAPECVAVKTVPCKMRASIVDMELILSNLIDNAFKYAGSPPEIRVLMQPLYKGRMAIRITDNGNGIPKKHRNRVFARFVRLGSELKREKPGTGLGLYIVRTLVKKLKGQVRIRDRQHGSGTVFELSLPVLSQATPPNLIPSNQSANNTEG